MILDRTKSVPDHEADHRISNNLAMVSGLLRRKAKGFQSLSDPVSGDDVRGVLEEAAFQIEIIANLHKLLSNKAEERQIDMDQYLRSVCNAAMPSLSSAGRVKPEYRLGCGLSVTPEFAVSVALAIAELLTNAIKYAHPSGVDGEIMVAAMSRGDQLVIEVADDGVGLPEGYDPGANGSFGLRLVRQTAERWGGSVEFESSALGLCVRLIMPASAGKQ